MEKIEHVELPTKKEKLMMKLKNFLKIRAAAYTVSTAVGLGAGHVSQNLERDITGYNPQTHAELKAKMEQDKVRDFEKFKQEKEAKEKQSTFDWLKEKFSEIKKGIANPREYIQNSSMYKEMYMKYLDGMKYVDDAAFIVPLLLTFIMLGGYVSRKLTEWKGNVVDKEEKARMVAKINELVDFANNLKEEIDRGSVTPAQIQEATQLLSSAQVALPAPEEMEFIDTEPTASASKPIDIELP